MSRPFPHRILIVIQAADKTAANSEFLSDYDTKGGDKSFMVGLSPTGLEPWTHYWACGVFSTKDKDKIASKFKSKLGTTRRIYDWNMEADPGLPDRVLNELGLKRPESKMGLL